MGDRQGYLDESGIHKRIIAGRCCHLWRRIKYRKHDVKGGGQNSILVNTTTDSPSNTGEDSAASSEKSSTSSNVESVGSENPASANSVSKAYEILDNIVKNPQSLVLPALLGFIALALLFVGYKRKSRKDDEY